MEGKQIDKQVEGLQQLADTLDSTWRVRGTPVRFGMDALVGLIPGIGDALSGLFSIWIVLKSWRLGASFATLVRMLVNVGVDVLVGALPLLGDLLDVFVKTNQANVRLLRHDLTSQGKLSAKAAGAEAPIAAPEVRLSKPASSTLEA